MKFGLIPPPPPAPPPPPIPSPSSSRDGSWFFAISSSSDRLSSSSSTYFFLEPWFRPDRRLLSSSSAFSTLGSDMPSLSEKSDSDPRRFRLNFALILILEAIMEAVRSGSASLRKRSHRRNHQIYLLGARFLFGAAFNFSFLFAFWFGSGLGRYLKRIFGFITFRIRRSQWRCFLICGQCNGPKEEVYSKPYKL